MTTNESTENQIIADGMDALEQMRASIAAMEKARDEQPARLAKAREDAEVARGWSLIEEPFENHVKTISSIDGSAMLALPSITARELWGARLCFDLLDCGDDYDKIDEVISRLFSTAGGDPGIAMVVMSSALSTIAGLVVPQLLDEIEQRGSNWDERVRLCEARAKAWNGRAETLDGLQDQAAEAGIKPVDAFDIGASALDGLAMNPVDLDYEEDDERQ